MPDDGLFRLVAASGTPRAEPASMIYDLFQAQSLALAPWRAAAASASRMLMGLDGGRNRNLGLRSVAAGLDLFASSAVTQTRPSYGIASVRVGNREAAVREEVVLAGPFGDLLHLRKDTGVAQPRMLVVAPMSGHFATLLRGTIRTLLPDHDVYVTDWHNARDVPLGDGRFDLDDFIALVMSFLETLHEGGAHPTHVLAVCQPAVPVLAAVSLMAQRGSRAQPRSMTLMAGPIDPRLSPTKVNALAQSQPYEWFEKKLIQTVPWPNPGVGRRVYPGFVQLSAFVSMNLERHMAAHLAQFRRLTMGDAVPAAAHREFYDEYLAVMDLPAEFFLQTIRTVFQEHHLAEGRMMWRGERVDPGAIRRTAVLTVEGENDDICAVGQTMAALDLCRNLRPGLKRHHLQTGVGHYGVFNGRRWAGEIYPVVRQMVQATS